MAQRLPATTGLSKAAQKELPECVDYVQNFNMTWNELRMYKLAAQHRLERTPVYKSKHRAVLQAMVFATDLVAPSDAGGGGSMASSAFPKNAKCVNSMKGGTPYFPFSDAAPTQQQQPLKAIGPGFSQAVHYAPQPVQQRPSLLTPPLGKKQTVQDPYSQPRPVTKAKYRKKAQQQPIFFIAAGKNVSGYVPLGSAGQSASNTTAFKPNLATFEHVEQAPGHHVSQRRSRKA